MADGIVQIDVVASSEGAESGFNQVSAAAEGMARKVENSAGKAGESVDSIGKSAVRSADQFNSAEGKMAASIKRATTNLEQLGKAASEKLQFQINQKGLDASKFEPMLAKLRELEAANARVGMSAAQMTNNLRMVPAQMTDIVTSLASGQQPLTVLIQQGGQLKDMFGGVGAAARALGGYVLSLATPLNVLLAAGAGVGYALYSASAETDEFRKNLILTGSTTGLTVDKFNQLAAALDGLDGVTRGGAAEALTAMAASGNISADAIERLTASALKLERAGGPAVADTVKQFEALGKAPVDASLKLNEATRYLTTAVYEQIKALEDQGKTSEAAAVAQKAWADAIDQRTPKMVENLGHIEKAWKGVKGAVAEAIDAAKDWGRVATPSERAAALHTQIGEIEKQLADPSTVLNRNRLKQDKQSLIAELQGLYVEIRKTHKEESEKTAAAAREQQQLAANVRWDKLAESQRSKREQYAAELRKLDADRAADLISEAKYRQAKADLARKYEEKTSSAKPKKSDEEKERERQAKLDAEDWARRVAYSQRVAAGMEKETDAIWAKVNAEVAAREAVGKSRVEIESRTLALMNEQLAWRDALGLQDEETEQLKRNIAAQKSLMDAVRDTDSAKQAEAQGKAAAEAHRKAAEAAEAEWQKTVDRIDQTFHDGFVGMLEKGKADWESFADSIANTFKTAVADEIYKLTIKPIVVSVVSSFAGGAAQAAGAATGQTGSGIGGVISGVQSAYGAVNGGIANAATAFATSGMGQYLGLSTVVPAGYTMGPPTAAGAYGYTAGGATALTGSGSTLSAVAAPATAALIGTYLMAEMAKAGWGMDNNRSAGGAYASNPYLYMAYQAGSRLFGHNRNISNDAAGIRGTFDLAGFSGEQYQERSQKGGTFRSDKRWTDPIAISSDMDAALDSMLRQTVSGLQAIGKTLNVETVKAMEGFSHEFRLQLTENGDWSKASEKIAAELKKVQDELVTRLVPNIADFARYGETASDTFGRLNQEVAATDAILLAMGKDANEAFGAVGLASVKAREDLIDLAGGLDALASKTQSFYANFYSSEEQVQLAATQAQKVLAEGFAELGQSIPATREAFRALVESQDLSTESGRKLWNSLLDLQDEFDTVADGADATAASMQSAADKLAAATTTAKQGQASLFDTFASDAQKLAAAKLLVSSTFAEIGKAIPQSAGGFLALAQSIDPATEAGQALIATLQKVSGAFAYVQTAAAEAAKQAAIKSFEAAKSALDGKSSGLADAMQSLVDRFGNLSPVARTVADDLAATRQQLEGLSSGLSDLFNAAQMTDLQKLGQTVGQRDQIRSAVEQLNSDIFEAALKGMSRQDQIGQLKKAEADLWAGMGTAADKGQQASKIRDVLLRRLGLESDDAKDSAGKVAELANQARKDQIDTLKAQIDGMQRMRDLAGQIADFTANLSIGDLSPLSYADQLSAAQAQFEQTLSKAKGGDQQAQGQLTNNAKTYLDEARSYFASSTDYAAIYEKVTGSLKSISSPAESTLTAAQAQLDTLSKLPDVMAAMVDTSKDDVAALQAVQVALRSGDDYLTKSIDAQTVALQKQIDTLTTIASNQDAQIKQAGAAYQQMTDELKAVKAQLAAIEANGALAGAA